MCQHSGRESPPHHPIPSFPERQSHIQSAELEEPVTIDPLMDWPAVQVEAPTVQAKAPPKAAPLIFKKPPLIKQPPKQPSTQPTGNDSGYNHDAFQSLQESVYLQQQTIDNLADCMRKKQPSTRPTGKDSGYNHDNFQRLEESVQQQQQTIDGMRKEMDMMRDHIAAQNVIMSAMMKRIPAFQPESAPQISAGPTGEAQSSPADYYRHWLVALSESI